MPYEDAFSEAAAVEVYRCLYDNDSRDAGLWNHERHLLREFVSGFASSRQSVEALDFACGFGRVASSYADLVTTIDGIDASEGMIAAARNAEDRVSYRKGLSCELVTDGCNYDLVTAFRFFLNTEPELRSAILEDLFALLQQRDGQLVVHNHGNRLSLRTPLLFLRGRRDTSPNSTDFRNTLGHREFVRLLNNAGFEVCSRVGFGLLPNLCYRGRLGPLARRLDPGKARQGLLRYICIETIYVARIAER